MKRILPIVLSFLAVTAAFGQDISLPAPARRIGVDLIAAIAGRSVSRTFVKKEAPIQDLSTILWAGLGQRPDDAVSSATRSGRTASFSGDTPYINLYVLTERGAWKYLPDADKLEFRNGKDIRAEVSSGAVPEAAFMVVFTVDYSLTPSFLKSNPGLFQQMAHATAGFAAQNVSLASSAFKMSSIIKYTLNAQGAAGALKLGKDEVPLFTLQAGYTEK